MLFGKLDFLFFCLFFFVFFSFFFFLWMEIGHIQYMNWGSGSNLYVAVRLLDVKVNNLLILVFFAHLLPCYLFLLLFLRLTFACTNAFSSLTGNVL
jgi:hypothetical protein